MTTRNRVLALGLVAVLTAIASNAAAVIVGSLSPRFDDVLRGGGVVAEGASLAGRADAVVNSTATISIAGIPAGATVQRALLYWAISGGSDTTATINGFAVTGALLLTAGDTCWGVNNSTFRADVTSQVTGNGVYTIGGLPSSTVATAADTDGAALVVVYQNPASLLVRRVMIRDGAISTTAVGDLVSDTFAGLSAPSATTGRFHIVVGDGQTSPDGNLLFNGTTIGIDQFPGSDGSLMDVRSYDVNIPALLADTTWTHDTASDCLLFETAVLDYNVPQSADLAITKTDGVGAAVPGGSVTYSIVASNPLGPDPVVLGTVADTFPASLTCAWACLGAGSGTCTPAGAGDINDTVDLPVGGSVSYTAICDIDPAVTGTLVNTATVAGAASDPDPANNSATDTDTLTASVDLEMTKILTTPPPINLDDDIAFALTATNNGPSSATLVTVTDTLPAGLTYVSNDCGAGFADPTLTWNVGVLGAGASQTCNVTVTVSLVGLITNTASVAGSENDPEPANNSDSFEVTTHPIGYLFADGFETGDTSRWNPVAP